MNEFTIIYKNKKLSNRQKMFEFRKIAHKAWEQKDYKKAIEFLNHAIDFCEGLSDDSQVLEWDLIRLYNEMEVK